MQSSNSPIASPATMGQGPSFSTLPAELRQLIIHHYLSGSYPESRQPSRHMSRSSSTRLTCKAARSLIQVSPFLLSDLHSVVRGYYIDAKRAEDDANASSNAKKDGEEDEGKMSVMLQQFALFCQVTEFEGVVKSVEGEMERHGLRRPLRKVKGEVMSVEEVLGEVHGDEDALAGSAASSIRSIESVESVEE